MFLIDIFMLYLMILTNFIFFTKKFPVEPKNQKTVFPQGRTFLILVTWNLRFVSVR